MAHRQTAEVLRNVRQVMDYTRLALSDLTGDDPNRRLAGFANVAVWGRSVTNVVQTLRHIDEPKFDAWYEPWRAEMSGDALLRYFYQLRTETLKEGGPRGSFALYIGSLSVEEQREMQRNPPPNAVSFFLGDYLGGNGWIVRMLDGTEGRHYVTLPGGLDVHNLLLVPDPPDTHLGQPIPDRSGQNLATLYVAYLSRLVSDAESQFST